MRTGRFAAGVLGGMLVLTACGGEDANDSVGADPTDPSTPAATPAAPTSTRSPLPSTYSPSDLMTFQEVPARGPEAAVAGTYMRFAAERMRAHQEREISDELAEISGAQVLDDVQGSVDGAHNKGIQFGGHATFRFDNIDVDDAAATVTVCGDQRELTNIYDDGEEVTPDEVADDPFFTITAELGETRGGWRVESREYESADCW